MYCIAGEYPLNTNLLSITRDNLADFLSSFEQDKEEVLLAATNDLFEDNSNRGYIYQLTEGSYSWLRQDEVCMVIEEGDLIGIEEIFDYKVGRYQSDFAVRCNRYSYAAIKKQIVSSPEVSNKWNRYICSRFALYNSLLLEALKGEKQFSPSLKTYTSDEVIIHQGTQGDHVFTLLNGHAKVVVDGVSVGEVLTDEIFGAIAALTEIPRTASVIATQNCMVLSIEREKFLELIESRPLTVLKMVQDMARTIVDLNKKVVDKSKIY